MQMNKSDEKTNKIALSDLGEVLKFHRKKAGLTQIELAKLAGVGKTAVFDVEKGTKQSRLDTILHIMNVLNIGIRFESPLMKAYEEQRHEES